MYEVTGFLLVVMTVVVPLLGVEYEYAAEVAGKETLIVPAGLVESSDLAVEDAAEDAGGQ